jgi:hypothetical protein
LKYGLVDHAARQSRRVRLFTKEFGIRLQPKEHLAEGMQKEGACQGGRRSAKQHAKLLDDPGRPNQPIGV